MDVVRSTRRAPIAGSPAPSGMSGKSDHSNKSTADLGRNNLNINGVENDDTKSPKRTNLNNTEIGPRAGHPSVSGSEATANGRKGACNYIPPVKSRDHNTRSKNGCRKAIKSQSISPVPETGESAEVKKMVDAAADQLARVDEQAYRRDQTKDSESVLSQLVLPMSFPWTHRVIPHQVIPRDIDDLEGILTCENEVHGQDRLGELAETATWTMPQHQVLGARRSSHDPGVIKFVRYRTPFDIDLSSETSAFGFIRENSDEEGNEKDSLLVGEIKRRKRRRIEVMESNAERFTISIRFGGTSSRSSLRPTHPSLGEPLVLLAKLPSEVAGGRRVDASQAAREATHLGSYDHRHGLPRQLDTSKRVRTGRTRTIWSSKQSLSQRPGHRSLLTGTMLENGQHRRPSDVKVFLRLNGYFVTLEKGQKKKAIDEKDDEWAGPAFASQVVDTALDIAELNEERDPTRENPRCSLNLEAYFESIGKKTSPASHFLRRFNEPYSVRVVKKDRLWVSIRPPRVWSHPCEDGVFQVVCSEPGELKGIQYTQDADAGVSVKSYPWATAILLDSVAQQYQTCCICWSESDDENDKDLLICSKCQVRVHPRCYLGRKVFNPSWCCESCVDYQERANHLPASLTPLNVRWARKCGFCDQFGSAVTLHKPFGSVGANRSWVHLHCRSWQQARAFESGVCIICSKTSQHLVRCGATGCSLKFHPMCAVVASHAAAAGRASNQTYLGGPIEQQEDRDIFLCTQYFRETVDLSFGRKHMKKRSIPVAYCGLHNPGRAPDRYGLLPGAVHFRDAVRLPLKRSHQISA